MSAPQSRNRIPLLLFAAGILASAALVASLISRGNEMEAAAVTPASGEGPIFDEWVHDDPAAEEGKGALLGHVERNGEMIEIREAPPEADAEADTGQEPDSDLEPPEMPQQ